MVNTLQCYTNVTSVLTDTDNSLIMAVTVGDISFRSHSLKGLHKDEYLTHHTSINRIIRCRRCRNLQLLKFLLNSETHIIVSKQSDAN